MPGLSPGLYLQYAARSSKNQHNTFQIKFNPLLFGRGERVHALVEFDVVRAFPVPPYSGPCPLIALEKVNDTLLQVHVFLPNFNPRGNL